MGLRQAEAHDIPAIMAIIEEAKEKLARNAVDQWQDGYPNESVIAADIARGEAYVWDFSRKTPSSPIVGYIMLSFSPDPDYANLTDGQWLSPSENYAVFHRLAIASAYRGEGYAGQMLRRILDLAFEHGCDSVRADTHHDNRSMQHTLENSGFASCGQVLIRGNQPRIAYENVLRTRD